MSWHVVANVGPSDTYAGDIPRAEPRLHIAIGRPGDLRSVNQDAFTLISERIGRQPSPLVTDLVHLSLTVFSADLRIERKFFDGRWSRDLVVHLPVSDPELWSGLAPLLTRMLAYLTGDTWVIRPRPLVGYQHPLPAKPKPPTLQGTVDCACLFSGGLDSLVGAIDLLEQGKTVALVGHHGSGITKSFQKSVLQDLQAAYGDRAAEFMVHAQPLKEKRPGEPSMRSRSLLFLSLGIAVASALGGDQPLVVAENGLISLNVALTNTRMGSLSTRTTHPFFIALFRDLLQGLSLTNAIETPYRFATKGEMLRQCRNVSLLAKTARVSMSCSHPEAGRWGRKSPNQHCGYCVPCIIRRASMVAAGLPDAPYSDDVLVEQQDPLKGPGSDLRAFHMALERLKDDKPHRALFRVLSTGPLPPEDATGHAAVFVRGMDEVRRLFNTGEVHGSDAE